MELERVLKNTTFLFIARGIEKATYFLVLIAVARFASKPSYAAYALALYFAGLFFVLFDMGVLPFLVREIARQPDCTGQLLTNGLVLKAVYAVVFLPTLFLVVWFLRYPKETAWAIIIGLVARVLMSLSNVFKGVLRAHGRMEAEAVATTVETVLLVGCTAWGFHAGGSPGVLLLAWIVNGLGGTLTSMWFVHSRIVPLDTLPGPEGFARLKAMAVESWLFGSCMVFTTIYFYLDTVILSRIDVMEAVANYTAAYNLVFALLFFPQVYADVLYPLLSNYYARRPESAASIVSQFSRYLVLIVIPMGVGTMLLAQPIISFFYSAKYNTTAGTYGAAAALQILVWDCCFAFLDNFWGHALAAQKRQGVVTMITGVGAALNIVLNIILIPRFSFMGAAVATVATEAMCFVCVLWLLWTEIDVPRLIKTAAYAVAGTTVMVLAMRLLPQGTFFIAAALFGASAYLVFLLVSGCLGKDDWSQLRRLYARSFDRAVTVE
jgi:O-antigen/teichoic acid export membrane protein